MANAQPDTTGNHVGKEMMQNGSRPTAPLSKQDDVPQKISSGATADRICPRGSPPLDSSANRLD
jgi:hypothetical protein